MAHNPPHIAIDMAHPADLPISVYPRTNGAYILDRDAYHLMASSNVPWEYSSNDQIQFLSETHRSASDLSSYSNKRRSEANHYDKYTSSHDHTDNRSNNNHSTEKSSGKKRFVWPDELHRDFISAVFEYGLNHANPKDIYDTISVHDKNTHKSTTYTYSQSQMESHVLKLKQFHQQNKKFHTTASIFHGSNDSDNKNMYQAIDNDHNLSDDNIDSIGFTFFPENSSVDQINGIKSNETIKGTIRGTHKNDIHANSITDNYDIESKYPGLDDGKILESDDLRMKRTSSSHLSSSEAALLELRLKQITQAIDLQTAFIDTLTSSIEQQKHIQFQLQRRLALLNGSIDKLGLSTVETSQEMRNSNTSASDPRQGVKEVSMIGRKVSSNVSFNVSSNDGGMPSVSGGNTLNRGGNIIINPLHKFDDTNILRVLYNTQEAKRDEEEIKREFIGLIDQHHNLRRWKNDYYTHINPNYIISNDSEAATNNLSRHMAYDPSIHSRNEETRYDGSETTSSMNNLPLSNAVQENPRMTRASSTLQSAKDSNASGANSNVDNAANAADAMNQQDFEMANWEEDLFSFLDEFQ